MSEKQKAILKAMAAVEKGTSISAAARQYGIPRSTLHDKIHGCSSVVCSRGPPTVLSKKEEDRLKRWITFMSNRGFSISKTQLLDSVSILLKQSKRDSPFQNGRPGRHWYEGFIKRHPEVGQLVAKNLTQTKDLLKESNVRLWFKEVQDYFFLENLQEAAQDPRRIFSCAESALFLSPDDSRVLVKRGAKNVYRVIPGSEKKCVTVLVTANAAGELAPPMVLFKSKSTSTPHKISNTAPNDWGLGITPNGWMTGESFFEYMTNVFFPWIEKSDIQLPIIFFVDGHYSYTTLPLSNFCQEKNIHLVALYPNATVLPQPMDVAVLKPLERIWKKEVYDWKQLGKFRIEHFCPLLHKSLQQLDPNSFKNGFKKWGLSPFDANNVDYSKCVTSHSNQMQSNTVSSLKYFESQISPEILKAFKANKTPTWNGDTTLEGLFYIWRQMHIQNNLSPDKFNTESTLTETSNMNESTSFGGIGNFAGLTKGNVKMKEVYESLVSETKSDEGERIQKLSRQSRQDIWTTDSKPIYLTPLGIAFLPSTEPINQSINSPPHTPIMNNELPEGHSSKPIYLTPLGMAYLPSAEPQSKTSEEININTSPHTSIMKLPDDNSSRSIHYFSGGESSRLNTEPTFESIYFEEMNMQTQLSSVKTFDRKQISNQKMKEVKTQKDKNKMKAKDRKSKKSVLKGKKKSKN